MHTIEIQEKGVKGASVHAAHKHFDLSRGAVVDVMYSGSDCQDPHGLVAECWESICTIQYQREGKVVHTYIQCIYQHICIVQVL